MAIQAHTQEVMDNNDPRAPQTVAAAEKQCDRWLLIGNQANIEGGFYRGDLDMSTARAARPTFIATWHPNTGPVEMLARGGPEQAYLANLRHYQANYRA